MICVHIIIFIADFIPMKRGVALRTSTSLKNSVGMAITNGQMQCFGHISMLVCKNVEYDYHFHRKYHQLCLMLQA